MKKTQSNLPKTSCLQLFLGAPLEGKAIELPAGEVIGGTVEMVALLLQSKAAFVLSRNEARPILYGGDPPPVVQLIVPRSRLERLIGALAGLRDEQVSKVIVPESGIVVPELGTPDMSNPATEATE